MHSTFYEVLPLSHFDAFGIGAILGNIPFSANSINDKLKKIPFSIGFFGSVILSILIYVSGITFLFELFVSSASFFIIRNARKGFTGLVGYILNHKTIQYLGKISYGLYVYHNFMPWLWRCITGTESAYPISIPAIHRAWLNKPSVALSAQFILLILISSLSWFIIEKPINDLKNLVGNKSSPKLNLSK
jgi:peptidoglycan/LPS O-acetylase OafA/YrhL